VLLAANLGCATVPRLPPRDGETTAAWIIWHDTYQQTGMPPRISWRRGAQLDCTDPKSGKPGFRLIDDVSDGIFQCREGWTLSPFEVWVADHGEPYSETALAHEFMHAKQLRSLIFDPLHERPEWSQVDVANDNLRAAGQ